MKKLRVFLCAFLALLVVFIAPSYTVTFADTEEESVYIGGFPIGISLDIGGLFVENVTGVETEYGIAAVEGLHTGDIIKKIDGISVDSADDISELISPEPTEIELVRNGTEMTVTVKPYGQKCP